MLAESLFIITSVNHEIFENEMIFLVNLYKLQLSVDSIFNFFLSIVTEINGKTKEIGMKFALNLVNPTFK